MGSSKWARIFLLLHMLNLIKAQEPSYLHIGCFKQTTYKGNNGTDYQRLDNFHQTCQQDCANKGNNYFGLQRIDAFPERIRCYCMSYVSSAPEDRAQTCWFICDGETCGGTSAIDIYNDNNECSSPMTSPCSNNQLCKNTDGGYECVCDEGYTTRDDLCVEEPYRHVGCFEENPRFIYVGQLPYMEYNAAIECQTRCSKRKDHYFGLQQIEQNLTERDLVGCYCVFTVPENDNNTEFGCSRTCAGMPCGGESHLDIYSDVDECDVAISPCGSNQTCDNTVGGFSCQCARGYKTNDDMCDDVDECSDPVNPCSDNALCENTDGNFLCRCLAGYDGDGLSCKDIDECEHMNGECEQVCTNYHGSYACACHAGFIRHNQTSCTIRHSLVDGPGADLHGFLKYGLGPSVGVVVLAVVLVACLIISKKRANQPRMEMFTVRDLGNPYESRQITTVEQRVGSSSYDYMDETQIRSLPKESKPSDKRVQPAASSASVGEYLTCGH